MALTLDRALEKRGPLSRLQARAGQSQALPVLAAAGGNMVWGFSFLLTRVATLHAPASTLLSLRFLISLGLLGLLILLGKGTVRLRGRPRRELILLSIWEPIYFLLESYGILYTNATLAGVVLALSPVTSTLVAIPLLGEKPSRRQALFCLLPVAGVALITLSSGQTEGTIRPVGVLLLLGACCVSAVSRCVNRKYAQSYTPFERTFLVVLSSAVSFTLLALGQAGGNLRVWLAPLTLPEFLLPLLGLSICCTVGCNLIVNYAAGRLPMAKFASFAAMETLCSMFAGVLLLGEPMTPALPLGAVMILVGLWQVVR